MKLKITQTKFVLKVVALVGATSLFGLLLNNSLSETNYLSESEASFDELYGSRLDDFSYLNEKFQARWLTKDEDAKAHCTITKHCALILVASVAECEKGAVVKFSVLDHKSKELTTEESDVFVVRSGEIVQVELGSKVLSKQGFIEPLDAYCKDEFPKA